MTLAELKAMKEKSDSIVATLKNDREVLVSTKQKQVEDNSKNLQEFLDSLKEYAELIPPKASSDSICTHPLFSQFKDHARGWFWEEDTRVTIYDEKISFLTRGGDECFIIDITKDSADIYIPSCRHDYSRYCFDSFKKFVLDHKEEVRAYVEQVLEDCLIRYVNSNKKQNDELYADIEKLSV